MTNLCIFILVQILSFDWSISQEEGLKPPNIVTPRVRVDLYYTEGGNVAVNCSADGNPAPTYKWMQNGTEITPQNPYITVDTAVGTLRIPSFSRREEATYMCTASNSFGNNKVVSFAAPVRLWQTRVERFTGDTVTQQVQNHEYLRLLCNKKAVVGSTIKFNWYSAESTSINLDNNRLFVDQEGNLHFTYLIDTDGNLKYMCGISVDQDKQVGLGAINQLVVNPNSNVSPIKPYLQYSNTGVKGLRFSSAKLECMFSGYNPDSPSIPTITWRDDSGKIIQNNGKFSLSSDGRTLTVMSILEEDEKYYSCSARNPAGDASGTVFLNVTSGPIFVKGAPMDLAVSQFTDATFSCDTRSASGEAPPSSPVWSINGEKMGPQTNPNKFRLSDDKKTLTVYNVSKPADIMCVQCEVSNDVDSVLANACLNVILPITIIKEPASVQEINYGDNVDLTVTATTDPAMVLSYRWVFNNKSYTGSEHPPYMYYNPSNNLAYINTSPLTQEQYGEIGGVYQRVIYHQFDSKTVEVEVILRDRQVTHKPITEIITTTETITTRDIITETWPPANQTASTPKSPPVRQDFQCHLTYIEVYIPVDLVPNSVLTLRDPSCELKNNGTHHTISFDYDQCGTSETFYPNSVNVENAISVHLIFNDTTDITFVDDYTIPLQCTVDRSKILNGAIEVLPREGITEHIVQSSQFYMKEFTTAEYNVEITEYPVKVPLNRQVFFELAVKNRTSSNIGIRVEKCDASPTPNLNETTSVSLIRDGCADNPAVKVHPSVGIDSFRFSSQAFHFSSPANINNLVYVHCTVSTCTSGCDFTCPPSVLRKRRSAGRRLAFSTLTSGSHVVANEGK